MSDGNSRLVALSERLWRLLDEAGVDGHEKTAVLCNLTALSVIVDAPTREVALERVERVAATMRQHVEADDQWDNNNDTPH